MSSKEPSSLLVTKANDLISASYRLTLQEQRLLLAAIAQVDPRKPMPSKITVTAASFSEIYGIPIRFAYTNLKEAADSSTSVTFRPLMARIEPVSAGCTRLPTQRVRVE